MSENQNTPLASGHTAIEPASPGRVTCKIGRAPVGPDTDAPRTLNRSVILGW